MEKIRNARNAEPKNLDKFGLSGSTLKIIAVISMAIDHFGVAIVYAMLQKDYSPFCTIEDLWKYYDIIRMLGRIAFPIYCFLIVEGFYHTSDRKKYAMRLALFALVSEIPFDLALYHTPFQWQHQNVFFELFLGLITIMLLDKRNPDRPGVAREMAVLSDVWSIFIIFCSCMLATICRLDYRYYGILVIVIMYMTRECRWKQCLTGAIAFMWEFPAPLTYGLLYFYNGKRGLRLKYFFYIFYPMHLLILYLFRELFMRI